MSSLFGLILFFYGLSLIFSMFCALVRFLLDVKKWHDKEEVVHITPSQFQKDLTDSDSLSAEFSDISVNFFEEGVESNVSERSEHHTPIIF